MQDHAKPQFNLAHISLALSLLILIGACAAGISAIFNPVVGITLGALLPVLLGAAIVQTMSDRNPWYFRLTFGVFSWGLASLTIGLSSSTIYSHLTARSSAIAYAQAQIVPMERTLNTVLASAKSAQSALKGWEKHSLAMADREASKGGSCPSKLDSGMTAGPISSWRAGEATISSGIAGDIAREVTRLENETSASSGMRLVTFADVKDATAKVNLAIESATTLSHGAAVKGALDSLGRAAESTIMLKNGVRIACDDQARTEAILRSTSALKVLSQTAPMTPVSIAVDLDDHAALQTFALRRSMNVAWKFATLGWGGSFEDDALWKAAYKRAGAINGESISILLGSLLEICVLVSSALVARRIRPSGENLYEMATQWKAQTEQNSSEHSSIKRAAAMAAVTALSPFYSLEADDQRVKKVDVEVVDTPNRSVFARTSFPDLDLAGDPKVPEAEAWVLKLLQRHFVTINRIGYAIVPSANVDPMVNLAVDSLVAKGGAKILTEAMPYKFAAKFASLEPILGAIPGAAKLVFRVFELHPSLSQGLRLLLLEEQLKRGGGAAPC
jgi:hypothetical protein